uniref:Tetratricopeptide repeat protein 36 n=1 Tax=Oryzias sinensis TaxID=183150 RepID=A0A8C8DSF7_9TELE
MASANDRAVLQAIFNPTSPFGDIPGINREEELTDDDSGFDTELLKQVKELEMRGVSAAEAGDLQGALQLFSQAIQILPERASAYNNRAQALRLQGDTAGTCNKAIITLSRALCQRVGLPSLRTAQEPSQCVEHFYQFLPYEACITRLTQYSH